MGPLLVAFTIILRTLIFFLSHWLPQFSFFSVYYLGNFPDLQSPGQKMSKGTFLLCDHNDCASVLHVVQVVHVVHIAMIKSWSI